MRPQNIWWFLVAWNYWGFSRRTWSWNSAIFPMLVLSMQVCHGVPARSWPPKIGISRVSYFMLYWLVVWNIFFIFPSSWEWKNHPNWRTHSIIFRGRHMSTPCQGGVSISGSMVWWGPKSWGNRCTESGNLRNSNPMGFSWVFHMVKHGSTMLQVHQNYLWWESGS